MDFPNEEETRISFQKKDAMNSISTIIWGSIVRGPIVSQFRQLIKYWKIK